METYLLEIYQETIRSLCKCPLYGGIRFMQALCGIRLREIPLYFL